MYRESQIHQPNLTNGQLSSPILLIWELTKRCNLSCAHCIASADKRGEGDLPLKGSMAVAEAISRAGVFRVVLSGGEPVCYEGWREIVASMTKSGVDLVFSTNGTAICDNDLVFLISHNVSEIHTSLDGDGPETHDASRGQPGSYVDLVRNLRLFVSMGMRVTVNTVLTKRNLHRLTATHQMLTNIGVAVHRVSRLIPLGRAAQNSLIQPTASECATAIADVLRGYSETTGPSLHISSRLAFACMDDDELLKLGSDVSLACRAGRSFGSISSDGTVAPCLFLRAAGLSLGNIMHQELQEIWSGERANEFRATRLSPACSACTHKTMCGGGCGAESMHLHGRLGGPDPYCRLDLDTAQVLGLVRLVRRMVRC